MCTSEEKKHDCFNENIPLGDITGNHLNNLLDLSSDMKRLFQSHLMTDVTLNINGKEEIYCHKDILKFRSKWFYNAVCAADAKEVDVIEIDENPRVMEAVLYYIYTGNLRLLESLDASLVEIYEAAEKYGFSRLREILKKMLQENKYREIMKYTQFQWVVKVENGKFLDTECPAVNKITVCGNDKWKMKAKCVITSGGDDYSIAFYVTRETEVSSTAIHNVHFSIRIADSNGKCQHFLTDKLDFHVDSECELNKRIPLTKLMKECDNLLSDDLLTFTCEVTFWARVGFLTKFRLADTNQKYISNELIHFSEDMFNVFRDGRTHDIVFSRCHVKIHNYILVIRSRIPKDFIKELESRIGFSKRLWLSFASFLYTGQARFLDEHARNVYCALSEMMLTTARQKYSTFLARNLTLENVFSIMNDAVLYEDEDLSFAAANFLASKSEVEYDPQTWIRIAIDKRNLLKFVTQYYIFKQLL